MTVERQRRDAALDWVRRIQDPDFADWDAHIAWLEADPRNAGAFDEAALLIEAACEDLPPPRPEPLLASSNDNAPSPPQPSRRGWRAGIGLAAAGALAALVAVPALLPGGSHDSLIRTAPGEQRQITLADGTRVALNGDTAIRLTRDDPRTVTIERGEAFFTVRHDAAHPFAVRAGDTLFQDVGTAFDVVRETTTTRVAVREGAVMVDPAGMARRLDGGRMIVLNQAGAVIRPVDAVGVGGWREGRLSYRNATLSEMAVDLSRNLGRPVTIDRTIADRKFSGVIVLDADRARLFRRLAAVAGVRIETEGNGWRMTPPAQ